MALSLAYRNVVSFERIDAKVFVHGTNERMTIVIGIRIEDDNVNLAACMFVNFIGTVIQDGSMKL